MHCDLHHVGHVGYCAVGPRTFLPVDVVHRAQQEACAAIWVYDVRAACVVGAARFYNRARLNSSLLIAGGGPVIYAANLFAPKPFVMAKAGANASYGEDGHDCCAVYDKDAARRRAVCGDDCEAAPTVRVDKAWLAAELRSVLDFRESFRVPVYIDQFGCVLLFTSGECREHATLRTTDT